MWWRIFFFVRPPRKGYASMTDEHEHAHLADLALVHAVATEISAAAVDLHHNPLLPDAVVRMRQVLTERVEGAQRAAERMQIHGPLPGSFTSHPGLRVVSELGEGVGRGATPRPKPTPHRPCPPPSGQAS